MALITHQTQGPYQTAFLRPKSCNQGINLRSFVAFQLVDRTASYIRLKHRFYSKSHPINSSKGKHFKILSFKGSAQNVQSDHSDGSSKFTNPPVKLSHTQEEREAIIESPDVQNHPISCVSEHKEDATTGSLAIKKLFRKWLLMLQTQASGHEDDILGTKLTESETSEGRKVVTLRGEAGKLLKSTVANFLKLDAAVSLPLLIFIPFYFTVRIIYGPEVTKELTPMWIAGPSITALYVKIIQRLCSLYVFCFTTTLHIINSLPSHCSLVSNYISEGKLKEYLWARFVEPIQDFKNTDYKKMAVRLMKLLREWAVEKYLDWVESIWPYYCRTIRFLKKANLI